jgi:UDP-glucose 4-epimerase
MLLDAGFDVSVLDDLSTGHRESVDSRASFTEGSILNPGDIEQAIAGCQYVVHFAGKSLVGESVEKPDLYLQVNVEGTQVLLHVMHTLGVEKIVFSSSAATYGEPIEVPVTEECATIPTNPYGLSKLKVENLLTEAALSGLAAISLRYFNVAGALQGRTGWLAERHNPETHLIPNVLTATESKPLKIFGTDWPTSDHTCVRDYVHVVDLIDAHIKALQILKHGEHQVINLGSGGGYSVKNVIDAAARVLGRPIPSVDVARRAGDPAVLVASIARAKHLLNWTPTRDLGVMVSDSYNALH